MKKLTPKVIKMIEIGSWYGVVAILTAYMGVSFGYFAPSNALPVFLNITGSLTMLVDAWKDRNWQPVTINVIWILIAVVTFLR
ncbi:MAG: CBU_0592 family membrane protein [Patescibacteria group bacterium]